MFFIKTTKNRNVPAINVMMTSFPVVRAFKTYLKRCVKEFYLKTR